jgi:maltose-binding protein MalE
MQVFKKSMDVGRAIPPVHDWTEIQDILANAISLALNGRTAPDEALKTAALKVNTEVLR